MDNPITSNPTPESAQPTNQSPAVSNKVFVIVFSVLLVIAVTIAVLFYFRIQKLSKELTRLQVQVLPTPTASQAPNGDLANWKTYVNASIGFSLKYPSDWDTPTVNAQQISFDKILTIASKTTTTLDQFVTKNSPTDKTPAVDYINGGLRGKKLIYKSGVDQATVDTVIAFQGQTKNVITFSYTDSPGHITKSETIDQILSTFKFLEVPTANPTTTPKATITPY